jgi:hypothetical protein
LLIATEVDEEKRGWNGEDGGEEGGRSRDESDGREQMKTKRVDESGEGDSNSCSEGEGGRMENWWWVEVGS